MDKANKINDEKTHDEADKIYKADQTTDQKKITLPKDLQTEMLKFFYKTSMPRIKKAKSEPMQISNVNVEENTNTTDAIVNINRNTMDAEEATKPQSNSENKSSIKI